MHNQDAMAVEKLAEGIRQFYADARRLEEFARTKVRWPTAIETYPTPERMLAMTQTMTEPKKARHDRRAIKDGSIARSARPGHGNRLAAQPGRAASSTLTGGLAATWPSA